MPIDRPRIAHVLHRMQYAGAEVLARDLSEQLSDRFEFAFLCLDGLGELGEKLKSEGQTVIDLKRQPGVDWAVAKRLKTLFRDLNIDLVHAHQCTPFFYTGLARRFSLRGMPPMLLTEHGRHYPDSRSQKRVLMNQLLLQCRDRVTAVGEFVRQALARNEGIKLSKIEVIYNGIDPQLFRTVNENSRTKAREQLDLSPEDRVVMQVARFHPVKDHETAVRALAHLMDQDKQAVAVFVGDGRERKAIQKLAGELGIAASCRFFGVRDDVHQLLPAADVFLLSSLSEGISVTLLEAMATGLPICTTEVGGNPEVVLDGQTGLLSPRSDAQQLGENLAQVLSDPEQARVMGALGRERVEQQFHQNQMHQRYAEIYSEMLTKRDS